MKAYEKLAVDFATALVEERWDDARKLLTPALQKKYAASALKSQLHEMFSGYAEGPVKRIHFDPEFSMEDWPAKKKGDIGWAYVSVEGDDFVEAVTLTICKSASELTIREIEWGRP